MANGKDNTTDPARGRKPDTSSYEQLYGEQDPKASLGRLKSRRYQPTVPDMLALLRSPALNELGTERADQPSVAGLSWPQPCARPTSAESARNSHAPPSR